MRISKVSNHGQTRFRVNEPQGPDGKRQRKFFDTREAAENYVKERTDDSKAFGIHFTTIPTKDRAVIVYQLAIVGKRFCFARRKPDSFRTAAGVLCHARRRLPRFRRWASRRRRLTRRCRRRGDLPICLNFHQTARLSGLDEDLPCNMHHCGSQYADSVATFNLVPHN